MKGAIIANRYEIECPVSNSGGMASVYLAHIINAPRDTLKVALKFSRAEQYGPIHEGFLLQREAQLLSLWDWRHPAILRVFPTPIIGGTKAVYCSRADNIENRPWFMAMEYLSGGPLRNNTKQIMSFSLPWKLELFYQVLLAINFIHQKGYGHRDLKPENIVFRKPIVLDEIPQPVLIDFALASDGRSGSETVETSYTLEYASPERLAQGMGSVTDNFLDPRKSDIWSLGIILFELLIGNLPFAGDRDLIRTTLISRSLVDVIENADYTRYMKVSREEAAKTSSLLSKIILRMVDRDPNNRPDIKTLIYAFEEFFIPPRIPSR